jgi:hypothetical protein
MIEIPSHSEATAGVSVGGKGVLVGMDVAVRVGATVKVGGGIGVAVGWARLEQAVRMRTSRNRQTTMKYFTGTLRSGFKYYSGCHFIRHYRK